jgi:hypothetical protein
MHPGFAIALVFITAIVTIGIVLKSLIDARYRRGAAQSEELSATRRGGAAFERKRQPQGPAWPT